MHKTGIQNHDQPVSRGYYGDRIGLLVKYGKLRVAHTPGIPGPFSPPPQVSDPDMRHGTCVTHVPWCTPGSLTSGFLWSQWWWKHSQHSRRMRNLQCYAYGKRPMVENSCRVTDCIRIRIHIHIHVHVHVHAPAPTPTHTRTHAHTHIYIYIYILPCLFVFSQFICYWA